MLRTVRRALAACLVAVLALLLAVPAQADDIDDHRAQIEREKAAAQDKREELAGQLEDTDAALAQAVLELHDIESRLPAARQELADAEAEVTRTTREAEQLAQRLEDARAQETQVTEEIEKSSAEVDGARSDLAEMARQAIRGEGAVNGLGIVTGAQDADEFVAEYAAVASASRTTSRTLDDLREAESVARNRSERLAAIRETIADLKDEADQNVVDAKNARQAAADRKAEIENLLVQQKSKQATIEERKAATKGDLAQEAAKQDELESDLKAVIAQQVARDERIRKAKAAAEARAKAEAKAAAEAQARADAAARKKSGSSSGGSSSGGSSGGGSSGGGSSGGGSSSGGSSSGGSSSGSSGYLSFLHWPTSDHTVTSSYGMRYHPVYDEWRLHSGTDLRAHCGTPVYASASGTVLYTRYWGGKGNQVMVDHGFHSGRSVMTSYNHLSRFAVSVGQHVSQGQVVGYSGSTGTSTACHLHFEIYINGTTINPMTVL
ncbi:M23 family metallopeptidase [Cellulomonas sp. PhB143]|uniref:M23 family metallopeptidase n=1 Tax=Cellulomonas sp. PhB143 TaxID=2485186 RepID=UPI000F4632A8|nr:M23 family metallopeptidase [Cellulomonas sp. PhB143]ROS76994.1 murein DD-endopeptidase MepM/ murein hydrolase activator NlpD [Cellulomonas sp. PhB143]